MRPSRTKHPVTVLRKIAGLTQQALAGLVGCSRMAIQSIESQKLKLSVRLAERISLHTGISQTWLLANDYKLSPISQSHPSQPYTREIFGLTRAEVCKPRNDPLDIRFIENVLASAYHDLNAAALQAYGTNQIVHFHYLLREFVNQLERHWKSSKFQRSMDVTETAAKFHQRFEKARRIRQGRKTNESSHH